MSVQTTNLSDNIIEFSYVAGENETLSVAAAQQQIDEAIGQYPKTNNYKVEQDSENPLVKLLLLNELSA